MEDSLPDKGILEKLTRERRAWPFIQPPQVETLNKP